MSGAADRGMFMPRLRFDAPLYRSSRRPDDYVVSRAVGASDVSID
jgi:hypothetical protein